MADMDDRDWSIVGLLFGLAALGVVLAAQLSVF